MLCLVAQMKKIQADLAWIFLAGAGGLDSRRELRAFWFAARGKCVVNVPQILGILIRARDAIYRVRRYAFAGKTRPPEEFSTRLLLQVPNPYKTKTTRVKLELPLFGAGDGT